MDPKWNNNQPAIALFTILHKCNISWYIFRVEAFAKVKTET